MKLNLDFLNNVKLVISGGILIILLTLSGYVVYNQVNIDTDSGESSLSGNFFTMVNKFKTDDIHFANMDQKIKDVTEGSNSTKVVICPDERDATVEKCPLGQGARENPFDQ